MGGECCFFTKKHAEKLADVTKLRNLRSFYVSQKNQKAEIFMAKELQIREALREAMSEEMRRDERVYLMGEEVAEYNGAYKVSEGMLAEFGD